MRIVSLINERGVIERILRHLGLWEAFVRAGTAREPPGEEFVRAGSDPWLDEEPFPDYEQEPVSMAS